jgi:molybdopterin-biosynthesis enzyme MoeA-like protein
VVIAVGDELLAGHTLDTNTHWLAQRLLALGRPLRRVHVVSDAIEEIVATVRAEVALAPGALLVCGGLGPTPDDRTLAALAVALDRPLELDPIAAAHIQKRLDWLHEIGRISSPAMTEANRRMAEVPRGSTALHNSTGMAPGLAIPLDGNRHLFVLPGVPRELKAIFDEEIATRYLHGGQAMTVAEMRFTGAVEAEFWQVLTLVGREFPEVSVGSYPQPDRGTLIIRVSGTDAERVAAAAELVRSESPERAVFDSSR